MKYLTMRTALYLIIIGILAGLTGIILTFSMHAIQHVAFGYGFEGDVSFREVVEYASPLRRLSVLIGCGILVGLGWFGIHRLCPKLVTVKAAIDHPEQSMPFKTTLLHGTLQIITVALGSPLGREAAPREITSAFATRLSQICHVDGETRKLLIACASGAGLAAVYNVPLAASVFALETLIVRWDYRSVSAALLCCSTAVFVVRQGLGDLVQYPLPQVAFDETFILWAALAGPVLALAVILFEESLKPFPKISRKSPKMVVAAILAFAAIGAMAMWFPEILGNGKAGNQLSFTNAIDWKYGIALYGTKWLAVLLATAAGAYGGRITPSMMLGGMLGLLMAVAWNTIFPVVPIAAAAFVCSAIYLGLAQKMPITAIIFLLELSRFSMAYLFPLCACLATALFTYTYIRELDASPSLDVSWFKRHYIFQIVSHVWKI